MAVWNVINHQELSGSAATVTHSSIPDSYDHLHGIISARSDESAYVSNVLLNFNNDTGSNYNLVETIVSSSSPTAYKEHGVTDIGHPPIPAASALADNFSSTEFWIFNYKNTTHFKALLINSVAPNNSTTDSQWQIRQTAGLWASTVAISEIDFTISGGHDFVQYSTFTLYGINGAA